MRGHRGNNSRGRVTEGAELMLPNVAIARNGSCKCSDIKLFIPGSECCNLISDYLGVFTCLDYFTVKSANGKSQHKWKGIKWMNLVKDRDK